MPIISERGTQTGKLIGTVGLLLMKRRFEGDVVLTPQAPGAPIGHRETTTRFHFKLTTTIRRVGQSGFPGLARLQPDRSLNQAPDLRRPARRAQVHHVRRPAPAPRLRPNPAPRPGFSSPLAYGAVFGSIQRDLAGRDPADCLAGC
jgi:hypothetical protein